MKIDAAVKAVYALHGDNAAAKFQNEVIPDLGHVYAPEMWAKTLKWLGETIGRP